MKMNKYIAALDDHLANALKIGRSIQLSHCSKKFQNVLICGLGGSGIGGTILVDLVSNNAHIPFCNSKNYDVPKFVNKSTLVIVSSYSGNTEEALSALKKCQDKGAEIACITSGGKLKEIAKKNAHNLILIPEGHPPRAMFGYSFVQLFFMLNHYGIIGNYFEKEFEKSIVLIREEANKVRLEAEAISNKLHKTTPVIYAASGFEGVSIRFRQQINENSKMLCWHHVIPEMNHNELLGWRTNTDNLAVVFLRNKCDHKKTQARIEISKNIISGFTDNITEIWSKGESRIENTIYLINLCDWISWHLSIRNNVDATEIDIINFLKNKLADIT